MDTYDKRNGKFHSRRKFDSNGNAFVDYDVADNHKSYDHKHNIVGNIRFTKDNPNLSKKEKRELRKAKKKRRFFK